MAMLLGTYAGTVEKNEDPLGLARLKVRVVHVYGASITGAGYIGTNDLPWAMPAGMPNGSDSNSGGLSHIPEVGDKVWVRFLDGEPEKPLWEWGMQTISDREEFKLHSYDETGGTVGKPDRAVWQKYNNAVEINQGAIVASTSQGYQMQLNDASGAGVNDGNVKLTTALGNFFKLDDEDNSATLNVLEDATFFIFNDFTVDADSYTLRTVSDAELNVSGRFSSTANDGFSFTTPDNFEVATLADIKFTAEGNFEIDAQVAVQLNFETCLLGNGADEPFVLGNQFAAWAESLLAYLSTHTHSNGNNGSPTGPPIVPPVGVVQPTLTEVLSTQILGL